MQQQVMEERSELELEIQAEEAPPNEDFDNDAPDSDDEDLDTITIVEALIFASDEPLSFKQIKDILEPEGKPATRTVGGGAKDHDGDSESTGTDLKPPKEQGLASKSQKLTIGKVRGWIERLNQFYDTHSRPFRIVEVAGGFAHQTIPVYGQYVGRLYAERSKRRLTQAALETLAIVAYKQPISKPAIEAIRGVNADYVIKSLLEKGLIAIVGREDTVGRPLLYGTTTQFLKHFGLHSLNDLPKPREIEELLQEAEEELAPPIEVDEEPESHYHDYSEPSIFDDVEREYGPIEAPSDKISNNDIRTIGDTLGKREAARSQKNDSEPATSDSDIDEAEIDTSANNENGQSASPPDDDSDNDKTGVE
jgi:segregation and condensation protein B